LPLAGLLMGAPHIERKCPDCGDVKRLSDFYKSRDGYDGYCKSCRRSRDRERAEQKAERWRRIDPQKRRAYKLLRLYGITIDDYNRMLEEQDFSCAICGGVETRSMYGEDPRLVVDHNHRTGQVRGLLCCTCNASLAAVEHEQFMLLAKEYLRRTDGYQFVGDP